MASPVAGQTAPAPSAPVTPPVAQLAAWQSKLTAHLQRFRRYPPASRRRGEQGMVTMRVTLAPDGQVRAATIAHGSGFAELDTEAQAWITRANPLPALPEMLATGDRDLMIPLRFVLE